MRQHVRSTTKDAGFADVSGCKMAHYDPQLVAHNHSRPEKLTAHIEGPAPLSLATATTGLFITTPKTHLSGDLD